MARQNRFVGRAIELGMFQEVLNSLRADPERKPHVLFIAGPGGIGKTKLIREILQRAAKEMDVLAANDLIDIYVTEHQQIDGLENAIIRQFGEQYFGDFRKTKLPKNFKKGMKDLIKNQKKIVVLAFDTFELIDTQLAGEWILSSDVEGLLTEGLLCIVGGRNKKASNSFIQSLELTGFDIDGALDLYQTLAPNDLIDEAFYEFVGSLVDKTKGHPLLLELTFRWWTENLWTKEAIQAITRENYEQQLMHHFHAILGEGQLLVGDRRLSSFAYDTIMCMAYLKRRFNHQILKYLFDRKLIHFLKEEGKSLEEYQTEMLELFPEIFFIKARYSQEQQVSFSEANRLGDIQLHDELRDLIMRYIWSAWKSQEDRNRLKEVALQLYDELIKEELEGQNE